MNLMHLTKENAILDYLNRNCNLRWKPIHPVFIPGYILGRLQRSGDQTLSHYGHTVYMKLGKHYYDAKAPPKP